MILEDRIEGSAFDSKCLPSSCKQPLKFKVILASIFAPDDEVFWHDGQIEIVEDDLETSQSSSQLSIESLSLIQERIPRVTFSPTSSSSVVLPPATEVRNICSAIAHAKRERNLLQFCLLEKHQLHSRHLKYPLGACCSSQFAHTISLESLLKASTLTTERSKKLPLKRRLFLALTLASTLIQLNATPWLRNRWSKRSIHFLMKATGTPDPPKEASNPMTVLSQVDLSRPLITQEFKNDRDIALVSYDQAEPRRMILELGILLLELGHETTLEEFASGIGLVVNDVYYDRHLLAHWWLDESEDYFTPTYFNVTARCVTRHFDGLPSRPVWGDFLFKGIVQGVIEPLQDQCRPQHR